jgi:hypothetical protein
VKGDDTGMDNYTTSVLVVVDKEIYFKYGKCTDYPGYDIDVVSSVSEALRYMRSRSYDVFFIDDVFLTYGEINKLTALVKRFCVLIDNIETSLYFTTSISSECLYGEISYDQLIKKVNQLIGNQDDGSAKGKFKRLFELISGISATVDNEVKRSSMTNARLDRIERVLSLKPLPPEAADHHYEPESSPWDFSKLLALGVMYKKTLTTVAVSVLVLLAAFFGSDSAWDRLMRLLETLTTNK